MSTDHVIHAKFERAQTLHRQGKLARARRTYEQILKRQPGHADALHFLGVLTFREGGEERAIDLIRQSIEQAPTNDNAYKNLGNIYLELDRFESAELCYRKAAELNPDDSTNFSNLCIALRYQGRTREAIAAGKHAVTLAPDNPLGWYSLGNALRKAGKLKQAIRCFDRSVTLDPSFAPAYDNYCQATFRLEQQSVLGHRSLKKTMAAYQRWLKDSPGNNIARFMLAALRGDIDLHKAPPPFVREMFDHFAQTYDNRLAAIEFRVPQLIGGLLNQLSGPGRRDRKVLDGGCGTGLCAPVLKPYASRLIGVDLSAGMMKKAERLGLYDELIESELTAFLQQTQGDYDLAAFSDTFCYFGELLDVFDGISRALNPGGLTVFSVERMPALKSGGGYRLSPHGRYSHSRVYIEECLERCGLERLHVLEDNIRLERGVPVRGLIVAARKDRHRHRPDAVCRSKA